MISEIDALLIDRRKHIDLEVGDVNSMLHLLTDLISVRNEVQNHISMLRNKFDIMCEFIVKLSEIVKGKDSLLDSNFQSVEKRSYKDAVNNSCNEHKTHDSNNSVRNDTVDNDILKSDRCHIVKTAASKEANSKYKNIALCRGKCFNCGGRHHEALCDKKCTRCACGPVHKPMECKQPRSWDKVKEMDAALKKERVARTYRTARGTVCVWTDCKKSSKTEQGPVVKAAGGAAASSSGAVRGALGAKQQGVAPGVSTGRGLASAERTLEGCAVGAKLLGLVQQEQQEVIPQQECCSIGCIKLIHQPIV
jgi:hypothetical protein